MAGFLAALPIIGALFETIERGIDNVHTSEEEKLTLKRDIMQVSGPVLSAVLQAQREFDQLQFKLREIELTSGDWFVRRMRPAMMALTFLAWVGAEGYMAAQTGVTQATAERAFYAFGLIGGLWTATRGVEKAVDKWATGANGAK